MPKWNVWFEKLSFYLRSRARFMWTTRAFWGRVAFCLCIGLALVRLEDPSQFDFRLQWRGPQETPKDIALILIHPDEWQQFFVPESINPIRPLKEITHLNDAYFWNQEAWSHILGRLLQAKPKNIVVDLFFDHPLILSNDKLALQPLSDEKVIWAAHIASETEVLLPSTAIEYGKNAAINDLTADADGVIRKIYPSRLRQPHMVSKLGGLSPDTKHWTINYLGPAGTITAYSLKEILKTPNLSNFFKHKIVIIGAATDNHALITPVGKMYHSEVLANAIENILHHNVIQNLSNFWNDLLIFSLLFLTIWIVYSYPQSFGLALLVCVVMVLTAFSVWAFDLFHYLIPLTAPITEVLFTFFIFLSFRLSTNERQTWQLQHESQLTKELELLKNNFISLFSHDLKTPIAKIQAIVDRRISTSTDLELNKDLLSLREANAELLRYIQSILKLVRVEGNKVELQSQATDINQLIEKIYKQLLPLVREKNLQVNLYLEPLFLISCDSGLIEEVILNLLDNAIKYTPQDGTIKVQSFEKDNFVFVEVNDTGDGIDVAEQEKVWQKFYRLKKHDMNKAGSGLGLYLAKYFIELHKGKMTLTSLPGQGTQIGFCLPIDETNG